MCKKTLKGQRMIHEPEKIKRGCIYCADSIPPSKALGRQRECPYDVCPYHELDDTKTYGEYLEKTDRNGLAKILELLE